MNQYKNPTKTPNTTPKGPVIKIPNSGPKLFSGAKITGPKNPAQKQIPPMRIAPINIHQGNPKGAEPSAAEPSLRHVNHPVAIALNKEKTLGATSVI